MGEATEMHTVHEPPQGADPQGPVEILACFHEAAHVIVDRALATVWVRGEEGMVETPELPEPDDSSELARYYWGHLCSTVAGDLGEFLFEEIMDTDSGEWPTHEERVRQLEFNEALLRNESLLAAFGWSQPTSPPSVAPRYPAGELGFVLRYAIMVTNRLLPVTARQWWGIARNGPKDGGPGSPNDASKALELALRLYCLRETADRPFGKEWPADEVDADGLFPVFHLIRYAEVEVEQILNREWASVHAVAWSLYRRKNHRMTGEQIDALLRRRGNTPSAPKP
jgi:hypothetical protein